MPIILGKRSSTPGACGVCASRATSFGVTNLKYPKMHEIMWVCGSCVYREKWERIYSMSGSKLTDIEERCIGIACADAKTEYIEDLKGYYRMPEEWYLERMFMNFSKKLLTEYQNQLKKFNN